MKFLALLSLLLVFSCSHLKKDKSEYSQTVSFTENEKKFSSQISLPKKFDKKIPLVVIVHEWWGRTDFILDKVKKINELGYAALAVDIYGDNTIVENPTEAQNLSTPFYQDPMLGINRIKKYLDIARLDPHIDENQIYVMGYCFGAGQALNLARSGEKIKGVISFHGALHSSLKMKKGNPTKILILNGAADPMVSMKDIKDFKTEMKNAKIDYKFVNYENALHAFTNPKSTEVGKKYNLPVSYDEKADQLSWEELKSFIK